LFRREAPDIVHILHPLTLTSAHEAATELGVPFVLTLTDYWTICPRVQLIRGDLSPCFGPDGGRRCADGVCFDPSWRDGITGRLAALKAMFDAAAAVVAPSRFVAATLGSNGLASREIRVIRHGMDYRIIAPQRRSYDAGSDVVFGFAGTISVVKGVHDMIEAWKLVDSPHARLEIHGGSTGGDQYLRGVLSAAQSDSRIRFHGQYEYDDIAAILNTIDVLIVPSRAFETSSLVTALGLAHEIPAIVQNMGAPPEIVEDGVNGYTFTPGDVRGLAEIVNRIVDDPTILNELRANIVFPPRIEEEALQYHLLYEEAIGSTSSGEHEPGTPAP